MKRHNTLGKNLAYLFLEGQGPTLLFLHGFAESHKIWERQIAHFSAKGYPVLAIDLPGFGASDVWPGISIDGMAVLVQELLHKENIHSCIVFGHSMGVCRIKPCRPVPEQHFRHGIDSFASVCRRRRAKSSPAEKHPVYTGIRKSPLSKATFSDLFPIWFSSEPPKNFGHPDGRSFRFPGRRNNRRPRRHGLKKRPQ
ncbi:MAG: alpha/beta fold hydrolase [Haliscomenobacter sp.]|nr:alpha/beta fold hydrolase [Haliscomenobacter sp.]